MPSRCISGTRTIAANRPFGASAAETVELSQVGAWIAQFNKTLDDLRDQTRAAVAQREELIARLSLVSLSEARDELSQLAAWVEQAR